MNVIRNALTRERRDTNNNLKLPCRYYYFRENPLLQFFWRYNFVRYFYLYFNRIAARASLFPSPHFFARNLTVTSNSFRSFRIFLHLSPESSLFPTFPSWFVYPALTLLDQYAGFQLIHGGYSPSRQMAGKHYSLPYRPFRNRIRATLIVLRIIRRATRLGESSCPKVYAEYMQIN